MYKLRHEAYDSNTLKNDIALFKMDAPVDTAVYLPACLPPPGAEYQGKTGEPGQVWIVVHTHTLWSSLGDWLGHNL